MRQDQYEALQRRAEELIDLFLDESDPAKWSGAGVAMAAMNKQTRGDRLYDKKSAVATLACAQRIMGLADAVRARTAGGAEPGEAGAVDEDGDEGLDAEVQAAMREAETLANRVMHRASQKANASKA